MMQKGTCRNLKSKSPILPGKPFFAQSFQKEREEMKNGRTFRVHHADLLWIILAHESCQEYQSQISQKHEHPVYTTNHHVIHRRNLGKDLQPQVQLCISCVSLKPDRRIRQCHCLHNQYPLRQAGTGGKCKSEQTDIRTHRQHGNRHCRSICRKCPYL